MLELPKLDDKTYRQILDEAVSHIPVLTDLWTDHNPSDTGIMLLELLASMTEQQNFYLDQVGERFYERYLDLVTDLRDGENVAQRCARFAQECAAIDVAVTTKDYEALLLFSPFGISRAVAAFKGGKLLLTVYRPAGAFDSEELKALRDWLEDYRLLSTRLELRQVQCVPVKVICKAVYNPQIEREELFKQHLQTVLERAVEEADFDEPFNEGRVLSALYGIAGLVRVEKLEVSSYSNLQDQVLQPKQMNGDTQEPVAGFLVVDKLEFDLRGE